MRSKYSDNPILSIGGSPRNAALAIHFLVLFPALLLLMTLTARPVEGQSFRILYKFTGGADGAFPTGGVTLLGHSLVGTTWYLGAGGHGVAYKLTNINGNWTYSIMHSFGEGSDGQSPIAPFIIGPDGALYNTTEYGGSAGVGTIFRLVPNSVVARPATLFPQWNETLLYSFQNTPDGGQPWTGKLVFDQTGNIFGTTAGGGDFGYGTVFEMTPSGDGWSEKVLYSFQGNGDGVGPTAGVLLDNEGNIYGTTEGGGTGGLGSVWRLSPSPAGWVETVLYSFQATDDAANPYAGLVSDQFGNLYGATNSGGFYGGQGRGGAVFELSPSGGGWTFAVIYYFPCSGTCFQAGPADSLTIDASGNLYGATAGDGAHGLGNVFKLTRVNGGWSYSSLHDFRLKDGAELIGSVVLDADGTIYGTAVQGGDLSCSTFGCGVVFEITP